MSLMFNFSLNKVMNIWVWLGSNKYLWKLEFKFHIISVSHEISFF